MNPLAGLLKSRKFCVALFDLAISLILYFGGKYLAPAVMEDVNFFIVAIQPVFLLVIGGIAYEDGHAKLAGNHPAQQAESSDVD